MESDTKNMNLKIILTITLVHFTGDFFNSFVNPLFPVFVDKLNLSLAQIGIIAGLNRFLAFIVQPTIGYMADRFQTRIFILGGVCMSVVFIPLSGIAPAYWVLLCCICLGSIGSSMFHPSLAGMVPLYAGRQFGFSMSLFNTGGTLAFGVGPVFVTTLVALYGLSAVPFTMLFGLAVLVLLFFTVPLPESEGLRNLGFFGSIKDALGTVWKSIALIWIVMVLRAIIGQAFLTFMPVWFVREGHSLSTAGFLFAIFTVSGTASGMLAGHFADRIGFKPVYYFVHSLMAPALIILLLLPEVWVFAGAALGGFFSLATLPLGVAMAQQLAPRGRSITASLMMGLAMGLGGIVSPLIGKLADLYSVHTVLMWVSFLPLVTLIPIHFFPEIERT